MKKIEQRYGVIIGFICQIINKYDPVNLIKNGAPRDEYAPEAVLLVEPMIAAEDAKQLRISIFNVFREMLGEPIQISEENAQGIAQDLMELKRELHYRLK